MKKKPNKLLNFIKKNKLLSILLLIFIVIIILLIVALKVLVFPNYSVNKYGNRLDNIDSVPLTNSRFNEIKDNFENVDGFSISKIELSGRIVNIYINVKSDFNIKNAKEKSSNLVNLFSEDELNYYDFQVFITCNEESNHYPIIGYKNKSSEGLYWNYEGEI